MSASPSRLSRKRGKTRKEAAVRRVSCSLLEWHVDEDRKSFLEAALSGAPGFTLRRLFLPRVLLKLKQMKRQRVMGSRYAKGGSVYAALLPNVVKALHHALSAAAQDVCSDPFPLEYNELMDSLDGEMDARCCFGSTVLSYPNESPESMMVHVVVNGVVSIATLRSRTADDALNYASPADLLADASAKAGEQSADQVRRRSVLKDNSQKTKMYYTANEIIYVPAALHSGVAAGRGFAEASGRDVLRVRELSATPYVVGAAEALGLSQFPDEVVAVRRATSTPSSNPIGAAYADLFSIRLTRLHSILQGIGTRQRRQQEQQRAKAKARQDGVPGAEMVGEENLVASKQIDSTTLQNILFIARKQALMRSYPMTELLLRQSWLLQDLPYLIVRSFLTAVRPVSVEAGGVIVPSGKVKCPRLYFLRRGTAFLDHARKGGYDRSNNTTATTTTTTSRSRHSLKVMEALENEKLEEGTSFGELTVLFGEPRSVAVVAKTSCDLWYLPRSAITRALRADDDSRKRLMDMAAALRCKWLGEQRYADSMPSLLRNSSPLLSLLPDPLLHLVQGRLVPVVYSPGTLVTTISTKCDFMLFIVNGQLHSITEGVASFGEGEVIGEACLLRHRWPFALTARRMVEGWMLRRKDWADVLERAEVLVAHSGECSLQVPALLRSVFGANIYATATDASGRSHMPIVQHPVPGLSFYKYVKQNSAVTLRALCLRFKAVVKWSDIICGSVDPVQGASSPRSTSTHALYSGAMSTGSTAEGGEAADPRGRRSESYMSNDVSGSVSSPTHAQEKPLPGRADDAAAGGHAAAADEFTASTGGGDASASRNKENKSSREGNKLANSKKQKRPLGEAFLFLLKRDQTTKCVADMRCPTDANHAQDAGLRIVQQLLNKEVTASSARREAGIRRARSFKEAGKISWHSRSATQRSLSDLPAEKSWSKTLHSLFSSKETSHLKGMEAAFAARDRRIAESGPAAPRRSASQPPPSAAHINTVSPGLTQERASARSSGYMSVMEAVQRGFAYQFAGEDTIQTCVSHNDPDVTVGLPSHRHMRKVLFTTPTNQIQKLGIIFASSQLLGKNSKGSGANDGGNLAAAAAAAASRTRRGGDAPKAVDDSESSRTTANNGVEKSNSAKQSERAKALTAVLLQAKRSPPTNTSMSSTSVPNTPGNIRSASLRPPIYPSDGTADVAHLSPLDAGSSQRVSFSSFKQPAPGFSDWSASSFAGVTATEQSAGAESPADDNALYDETPTSSYQRELADADAPAEIGKLHHSEADAVSSSQCSYTPHTGPGKQFDEPKIVTPRDFAMPDPSETEQLIRRLQRNVKGVNRLAKALRMERLEQASLGEAPATNATSRLAKRKLNDAIELLHQQASEPLGHVTIAQEWAPEGGADFLASDLRLLLPQSQHRKARLVASAPPRSLVGVSQGDGDDKDVEGRLTACAVGGRKFSYAQHPLVGPQSYMTAEEYANWISSRNELLARCAAAAGSVGRNAASY